MNKKTGILFFLLFIFVSKAISSTPAKSLREYWVDSVYHALSYEQRIGQLIVSKKSDLEVLNLIENGDLPIGGIYLNPGNIFQVKDKIIELNKQHDNLLWVFARGQNHLEEVNSHFHSFPNEISMASLRDLKSVENISSAEIQSLKELGTNVFFDEDVYLENVNGEFIYHLPLSPLASSKQNELIDIRNRSFQDLHIIQSINLNLSFGHYDFVKYIPESLYRGSSWQSVKDQYPILFLNDLQFRNGWDSDDFKKEIVKNLIRDKFEYEGILALDIENYKSKFQRGLNRNSIESELISSGVDVIVTDNPVNAYKILYADWKKHELKNGEIEDRVKQVLRIKYDQNVQNSESPINILTKSYQFENTVYESYAETITLVENENDIIPVKNLETKSFASLSIGADEFTKFQETLDKYTGFTHFVLPANQINSHAFNNLVKTLSSFDIVVVGIHAPFNKDMLSLLASIEMKTHVITALFNENIPDNLESVTNSLVISYENNEYTQQLVPQIIFGARPCMGKYPDMKDRIPVNSIETRSIGRLAYAKAYKSNMDEEKFSEIDEIAEEAIREEATPGCQILVAKNGNIVYEKSFGNYTYDGLKEVTNRTIYDLASVTKVAATTQAIMFLADQGVLDLDQKLGYYLPELEGTNKADLIIRDVLTHQSGLKGFLPLWHQTIDFENLQIPFYQDHPDEEYPLEVGFGMYGNISMKDSIYKWTIDSELRRKPRNKRFEHYDYKYSDLGFYLMYVLAERLLNQPMDEFLEQNLYEPLGMSSTTFNPMCKFPVLNMAPTEDDKTFRHSLVWGSVHDQIAAMNGGVSGHAGLFSDVVDLAKLAEMQLQGGKYGGQKYFSKEIINEFTTSQFKDNRRGLGWDKPDTQEEENNPASNYASQSTYGHRGFTGTVIWVDPEQDLIYVFLSNRVYPDMTNNKLNELDIRKRIHDVVYESIINFEANIN